MAETHSALGEQFEEMPQQRDAATMGMWIFLATEILFFGVMFMAYIVYRHAYPAAFAAAAQHTLVVIGTINSAILLTSSLTMTLAVLALRVNQSRAALRLMLVTIFLGVAFLGFKGYEYSSDLHEHLWPGAHFKSGLPVEAQLFWILYWIMTGVHTVHLIVGIGVLSVIAWKTSRGKFSANYHTPVDVGALYWHFVDVVWIYLYALIYLVHRSS